MLADYPDLQEATIKELQHGLAAGLYTSHDLVRAYVARIHEVNDRLNAVISISPAAYQAARELDEERRNGKVRSPLHGIPIAIKDNIATRKEDGMDTTAGSFALQGAVVRGDADCVANLREAGAIILCKTNMSEWANMRGNGSSGWSPVGKQCFSPYYPQGVCSGSSSGSAVAAAIGLVSVTLGTETDSSIISPASRHSLVGLRPTVGLVSQTGVVPITSLRDVVGPMTRSVEDTAFVLDAICGREGEYAKAVDNKRLDGIRLLFPTNLTKWDEDKTLAFGQREAMQKACRTLKELGAECIQAPLSDTFIYLNFDSEVQNITMQTEFVRDIAIHLSSAYEHIPSGIQDLKDIAQYTRDDPRESPELYDACQRWDAALARHGLDSDEYRRAKGHTDQAGGLIKEEMKLYNAQAIVMLSSVSRSCRMWSDAGYPQITIPLGYTMASTPLCQSTVTTRDGQKVDCPWPLYSMHPNMPFGVTFAGDAFSEAELLGIGYAYEQATQVRKHGRTYEEATPQTQIETIHALRS